MVDVGSENRRMLDTRNPTCPPSTPTTADVLLAMLEQSELIAVAQGLSPDVVWDVLVAWETARPPA